MKLFDVRVNITEVATKKYTTGGNLHMKASGTGSGKTPEVVLYNPADTICVVCHKPGATQFVVTSTGEVISFHKEWYEEECKRG